MNVNYEFSKFVAAFFASLTVCILSELFAKIYKNPATMFILPGLLPLVPGAGVYYTMYDIVTNKVADAVNTGIETLLVAGALALGIIVSSVFSNSLRKKNY